MVFFGRCSVVVVSMSFQLYLIDEILSRFMERITPQEQQQQQQKCRVGLLHLTTFCVRKTICVIRFWRFTWVFFFCYCCHVLSKPRQISKRPQKKPKKLTKQVTEEET